MENTIAAISTALQPAGISIVRVSGPEAVEIADRIYKNKSGIKLSEKKSHTINYGFISDGTHEIDEVLVSVMRAPHTFTGEDTVEINCHGGIVVTKKILNLLIENGAVPAEPGEFTKRAFLNGRMDLSKAEAVIDVIDAKNEYALKASVSQLKGAVSKKIKEVREMLLDEVAFIEAALDDPEHYDLTGFSEELSERILPVQAEIKELLRRSDYGEVLSEGIRTVIAGRPNAGKSSLLNLLAGYEKAIVTEIAGTTRDVLEVNVNLGEISLILMDTAGIRETEDVVEKIGVERSEEALKKADLILYLVDASEGIVDKDLEILNHCGETRVILLINKTDLVGEQDVDLSAVSHLENILVLPFSAKTGNGLKELENKILSLYETSEIGMNDQVIITNAREKAELLAADRALTLVQQGIGDEMSEEFLTVDLMNAYTSLGKIIGEEVEDDVIDRVFEKFCMGK